MLWDLDIPREKWLNEVFANNEDPDQTPQNATSDLGLHCLPNTLVGVSRLQWVNWQAQNTNVDCTIKLKIKYRTSTQIKLLSQKWKKKKKKKS